MDQEDGSRADTHLNKFRTITLMEGAASTMQERTRHISSQHLKKITALAAQIRKENAKTSGNPATEAKTDEQADSAANKSSDMEIIKSYLQENTGAPDDDLATEAKKLMKKIQKESFTKHNNTGGFKKASAHKYDESIYDTYLTMKKIVDTAKLHNNNNMLPDDFHLTLCGHSRGGFAAIVVNNLLIEKFSDELNDKISLKLSDPIPGPRVGVYGSGRVTEIKGKPASVQIAYATVTQSENIFFTQLITDDIYAKIGVGDRKTSFKRRKILRTDDEVTVDYKVIECKHDHLAKEQAARDAARAFFFPPEDNDTYSPNAHMLFCAGTSCRAFENNPFMGGSILAYSDDTARKIQLVGIHKDNKVALKHRTARKTAQVALGSTTGLTVLAAVALVAVSLVLFITTGNPPPMPLIISSITAISTAVVSSTAVGIHTPFFLNDRRSEKLENVGGIPTLTVKDPSPES